MGGLRRKRTRPYGSSFSSISMVMEEKFPMTPEEFPYGNRVNVNCSFNYKRTQTINSGAKDNVEVDRFKQCCLAVV